MLAVCWRVIDPSIGKRFGSTVVNGIETLTCTCESDAHGAGLHCTVPDQLPAPRSWLSLAVPAACTASGAATTPERAASRAAVVSRFIVNQARLSSTLAKRTKS